MKTKKFLAILLSLAVLIGLLPMAGMLASAADTTEATNTVFTVDFAKAGDTFVPYNGPITELVGHNNPAQVMQFEFYYCVVGADIKLGWGSGNQTVTGVGGSASTDLVVKGGTYDNVTADGGYIVKTTCTVNKMCPTFTATGPAKLYIWDVRFVSNLSWKTVYRDLSNYDKATTTATVAKGNAASTYDFKSMASLVGNPSTGTTTKPAGGTSGSNKIIRINLSTYDWEENEYIANCAERLNTPVTPKQGDKIVISFEYCITNDGGKISVYNDWYYHNLVAGSFAFENNENGNYVMTAGKKGKAETSFTASEADARRAINLIFEGNVNDGVPADLYIWNFSIKVNGVEKMSSNADVSVFPIGNYGKYFSMVDVDPATLTPGKALSSGGEENPDEFDTDNPTTTAPVNKPTTTVKKPTTTPTGGNNSGTTPDNTPDNSTPDNTPDSSTPDYVPDDTSGYTPDDGTDVPAVGDDGEDAPSDDDGVQYITKTVINWPLVIIIAASVLVLAGAGLTVFFILKKRKAAAGDTPDAAEAGETVDSDSQE